MGGIACLAVGVCFEPLPDFTVLTDPEGAKLRPYQREGAAWLVARAALALGGILADDMGLGKTSLASSVARASSRNTGFFVPALRSPSMMRPGIAPT